MKKRTDFDSETRLKKYEKKGLRVFGVRYVSTPDADSRIWRAINILLGSAVEEPEGGINTEKEEEPAQGSRPERVAGQSDGGKG